MIRQQLIAFLRSSGHISEKSAEEIVELFKPRELSKGQLLLKAGHTSDEYLFLATGLMRAFALDPERNEVTTAFYTANGVVFEVSSFFNRKPAQESIQALTDCAGCSLNFAELNMLFHSMPEFRDFGRSILVKGFAALKDRMLSTITETADQRYQRLLETAPAIIQQAPLKYVASYLGVTDTSLSRIRKEISRRQHPE